MGEEKGKVKALVRVSARRDTRAASAATNHHRARRSDSLNLGVFLGAMRKHF
jgi:hypothetical protein